jgi:hypothetical protein
VVIHIELKNAKRHEKIVTVWILGFPGSWDKSVRYEVSKLTETRYTCVCGWLLGSGNGRPVNLI